MRPKTTLTCVACAAMVVFMTAGAGYAQTKPPDPIEAAKAILKAAEEAAAKAAADATAAEKVGTDATAAKAAADKLAADRKAAAEKIAAEKAEAEKIAAEKKAAADKASADKAAADKDAADKTTAASQATQKANQAKTAAQQAAAQIPLAQAAVAHTIARKADDDRTAAQTALNQKTQAANTAVNKATTEKAAADKAAAEVATAKTAADKAGADHKAAAERTTAAKAALEKAAADQKAAAEKAVSDAAAVEKTAAEQKAATEKAATDKAAAAKTETDKAAAAKADADKAAAEKIAAEQTLAQKVAEQKAAVEQAAAAKAVSLGGLKPMAESAWDQAKARHLLWRAGFGGTADEVAKLHAMGLHGAVAYLVNYENIPSPNIAFQAYPPERPLPYESKLTQDEQFKVSARRQNFEARQIQGLRNWWLQRMVESPRPLEEKLTLFWHGHFACQYTVVFNSYVMFKQNEMFRFHANRNYGALLRGLVHDPTMIRYLNNDSNTKGHANENLAREILELFSMGTGNYTEEDIRQASKALTGYTFDYYSGEFRFVKDNHDDGPKTIWGRTGNFTGDDLVDLIMQQPATARFIAKKLFVYFAHESPDDATIDRLASVLRTSNYEISEMLENLFLSDEFYSPKSVATQIKSPAQLLVGTMRSLGIKDANYGYMDQVIRNMGQELLEPPNVKGWDGGRTWIDANRIFHRYNAVSDLVETVARPGNQKGVDVIGTLLAGKSFQNPTEVVDFLAGGCLLAPMSAEKRQLLINFVSTLPPCAEWANRKDEVNAKLTALLVMMMSSPEYQLT